jgi:hypothetical protein
MYAGENELLKLAVQIIRHKGSIARPRDLPGLSSLEEACQ